MERCAPARGGYRTCSHIFSVPILVNSCRGVEDLKREFFADADIIDLPPSSFVAVTFLPAPGVGPAAIIFLRSCQIPSPMSLTRPPSSLSRCNDPSPRGG